MFTGLSNTIFMAVNISPPQTSEYFDLLEWIMLDIGLDNVIVEHNGMPLNAWFLVNQHPMFVGTDIVNITDLKKKSLSKVILEFKNPEDALAFKLKC